MMRRFPWPATLLAACVGCSAEARPARPDAAGPPPDGPIRLIAADRPVYLYEVDHGGRTFAVFVYNDGSHGAGACTLGEFPKEAAP